MLEDFTKVRKEKVECPLQNTHDLVDLVFPWNLSWYLRILINLVR